MALKKNISFRGLVVEEAYVRVVTPTIAPGNTRFVFVAQIMASAEHEPLSSSSFEAPYSLLGSNPVEQAYEYLKTLPEFEGCTDC
ncbi:UNVERIFIED_ORG: hypothetical protein J2W87_001249 [Pseudomonas putida]|nr:hypothetical protein [Pseudomonas putida]